MRAQFASERCCPPMAYRRRNYVSRWSLVNGLDSSLSHRSLSLQGRDRDECAGSNPQRGTHNREKRSDQRIPASRNPVTAAGGRPGDVQSASDRQPRNRATLGRRPGSGRTRNLPQRVTGRSSALLMTLLVTA